VAYFDRSILPEGREKSPCESIREDTTEDSENGQGLHERSENPQDYLVIEALIKTPIVLSERMVFLQGTTQETITRTVDIKGDLNKPLKLEPVTTRSIRGEIQH